MPALPTRAAKTDAAPMRQAATRRPAGVTVRRIMASGPAQVGLYLILLGALIYASYVGAARMGYNWQWYNVPRYLIGSTAQGLQPGALLVGLGTTVAISLVSFLLAALFGLGLALLRLSGLVVGRMLALCLVELLRNVPLLVLVYIFYFVLGPILGWGRVTASIMVLAVFHSVLVSEIIRGGITSVARGQWEAASSIGMTRAQAYRYIVLPQALKIMLPPLTNEAISLIKSSAIVSVIGVTELTTTGRNVVSDTYMSFEIWFTVAALYLVLTVLLSMAAGRLEARLKRED